MSTYPVLSPNPCSFSIFPAKFTENFDDDGEIDPETMEKIRIYQVNRLKYYYAVAEFNSVEAADKVTDQFLLTMYKVSMT
jgi:hypothetical protein